MKKLSLTPKSFALAVLLILSLALRLYRIESTQTFLEDEGRDMLIVKRMLDTGRPVLLGPQTSTGNMYLGPLYYYLITPALLLANMDPLGPAVFIALTGVLTVYLLYLIGSKWFGSAVGFAAASLYGLLPLTVAFTRNSWNPNLVPLISLLIIYVVDKLLTRPAQPWRHFLVLGVLFGVMAQLHYMAMIMVFPVAILLIWWWRTSPLALFKGVMVATLGLILTLSPFLLFEARNDFVNTKAVTRFLVAEESHDLRYDPPFWLWWSKAVKVTNTVVGGLFSRSPFVAQDPNLSWIVILALTLTVLAIISVPTTRQRQALLFVTIFGSLALLGFYQENIHRHYLGFLFSLLVLSMALGLASRLRLLRLLTGLSLIFLFVYLLPTTLSYIQSGPSLQKEKALRVAQYIGARGGAAYNVVSDEHSQNSPYQYYLALLPNRPANDLTKKVFVICEGEPCVKDLETTVLLFLPGPAHPALTDYLGHPQLNSFEGKRQMLSNNHVFAGTWVAELVLE